MKITNNFYNKVCQEIGKAYFPEVKYYRDNKNLTIIHYAVELFNNGVITYRVLIQRLSTNTKQPKKKINSIVSKYIDDFEGYNYMP